MIVGLTGGIACGKTTIANRLISYGIDAVDADMVAREVVAPKTPALTAIAGHFGQAILQPDGSLDRRALRNSIFENSHEREWLEALLHPLIREELLLQLHACHSPYALLIAPLLFENGLEQLTDRVLVIDIPVELQIIRATQRDQMSEIQARQIIATQISRENRLAKADDVIDNSKSLEQIYPIIDNIHNKYIELATEHGSISTSY